MIRRKNEQVIHATLKTANIWKQLVLRSQKTLFMNLNDQLCFLASLPTNSGKTKMSLRFFKIKKSTVKSIAIKSNNCKIHYTKLGTDDTSH